MLYRDIATRNLLVDDQWTVRISGISYFLPLYNKRSNNNTNKIDFGLARIKVKATSQTKSSVGPVKWMVPIHFLFII